MGQCRAGKKADQSSSQRQQTGFSEKQGSHGGVSRTHGLHQSNFLASLKDWGKNEGVFLSPEGATELLGTAPDEIKLDGAARMLLAVQVENVEAAYEELIAKGVRFLRPPIDHPWGKRTAPFADPEGNLWEISQDIPAKAGP